MPSSLAAAPEVKKMTTGKTKHWQAPNLYSALLSLHLFKKKTAS